MFIMRSCKSNKTEGIELLNQERVRTLREKETHNYLGILEEDTIKQILKNSFFFQTSVKASNKQR